MGSWAESGFEKGGAGVSGVQIKFETSGPVANRFFYSRSFIDAIMGPVGGAKTSHAMVKQFGLAGSQVPSPIDGRRRFRTTIVRDTYRNLWRSTIPDWLTWAPRGLGKFTGSDQGPASHVATLQLPDGELDFQADFVAIGDNRAEEVLRGYPTTRFLLDEADLFDPSVLDYCTQRAGRYPPMRHGGPVHRGVDLSFNAPDEENYLYPLLEEEKWRDDAALLEAIRQLGVLPEGVDLVSFYQQPSGLSPEAENMENLAPGYYQMMMIGKEDWWIRRYIHNRWGYSRDGQPVFLEFDEARHVANSDLVPLRGRVLEFGVDAGRTPAVVIGQRTRDGQYLILDELAVIQRGAEQFGRDVRRFLVDQGDKYAPWLEGDFPSQVWGDPAADYNSELSDDETWLLRFSESLGLPASPAPSPTSRVNALTPRLDAVRSALNGTVVTAQGPQAQLRISRGCRTLTKAFASMYRYKRIRTVGSGHRFDDKPEKNDFSHISDALQYLMLGFGEYQATSARLTDRQSRRFQVQAIDDENPQGAYVDSASVRDQAEALD